MNDNFCRSVYLFPGGRDRHDRDGLLGVRALRLLSMHAKVKNSTESSNFKFRLIDLNLDSWNSMWF